ncbi:hypothetical protein RAZWK3B_17838 [Roseobacter sp. AzwK-3b]|nr:hypothetical protein RAZWK3B_17838 [Roseobacter sp. AzwK-3b]
MIPPGGAGTRSAAVIHHEFDRMGCVLVCFELFHLEVDIAVDLVLGEDVTGQQEGMVGLQGFERFAQAAADGGDAFEFLGGQIVEVLVHGFARIDLVLDAVEAGHQQGREAQIGVGRRIGEAGFDALCLGRLGPWDPDAARPVAGRIRAQNRGFEAGDQTLVGVGGRVGEGVERLGVLEDAADEIQRFLAEIGVFVACEERLAVFPDRHVHVHAGAIVAIDRLGHEGGRLAVGLCHVVDHVFVFLKLIGLRGQRAEDQAQLVLARRHLVVVLVDLHAKALHGAEHFRADILTIVDRVYGEIAALDARTMAGVAHFVFGVGVPRGVERVDFVGDLVDLVREAHVVEQEEFGFGAEEGGIADARGFQVGFCLLGGAARVTLVGFAGVGLDHRAMHAEGFLGVERVDIGRLGVGHQFHVGGFDRFPAGDRGAVEHEPFFKEVFIDQIGHHGDVLQLAARVGEADVDVFYVFFLDLLEDCFLAHVPSSLF